MANLISVIVPIFNGDIEIISASLKSILNQEYKMIEIVIVDDSTDPKVSSFLEDFSLLDKRFIYLKLPERLGIGNALCKGIEKTRGKYIARMDSDDVMHPERLTVQSCFLDNNPSVGIVGSWVTIIERDKKRLRKYPTTNMYISLLMQIYCTVAHPTIMIRKEVLDRWGSYDPSFRFAEDVELWLRLINNGVKFSNIDKSLLTYRSPSEKRSKGHYLFLLRARISNLCIKSAYSFPMGICGIVIAFIAYSLPQYMRPKIT